MEEIEGYLRAILDDTSLLDKSKEILLEEAIDIYEDIRPFRYSGETKANVALYLACDEYPCAIPKKIPKPKLPLLHKARKETGIKKVDVIERIDSMCKLADIKGGCIPERTKYILKKYREKDIIEYGVGAPVGTAVSAIYIASKLCDEPITQRELQEYFGVNDVTIRKRYKEIANKLDIYF
ncbi:MAG: hypothetical protein KAT28_05045 [Candidatus Aenigmarchaeota archaeon]|nr:hypothetical protein [Candidatus Aenigmarchaeota archaeon]